MQQYMIIQHARIPALTQVQKHCTTISCFSLHRYVYLLFSFVLVHFANSMRSVYVPFNAFSFRKRKRALFINLSYQLLSDIYTNLKRGEITFYQLHHKCLRYEPNIIIWPVDIFGQLFSHLNAFHLNYHHIF